MRHECVVYIDHLSTLLVYAHRGVILIRVVFKGLINIIVVGFALKVRIWWGLTRLACKHDSLVIYVRHSLQ